MGNYQGETKRRAAKIDRYLAVKGSKQWEAVARKEGGRKGEGRSRWLLKIALSFSASIDAGVAVVNVCSVMSKRHDGAGIIYAGRGSGVSRAGRLREFALGPTLLQEGHPARHLQEQLPRLKSMIFVWIARRELACCYFFFAFPPLKAFEWTTLRGLNWKEGRKGRVRPTLM